VPIPEVPSWEALNALLAERCAAEDERTVAGRPAPIGGLWREEQAALLPLQRHAWPACRTVPVRASRLGLVTFERNRYSVPSRYAGERLLLRAVAWHVDVSDGQTLVARHARLYERDGEQLDPLHYPQVLERKPGAFDLARPIQRWAKDWPPVGDEAGPDLRVDVAHALLIGIVFLVPDPSQNVASPDGPGVANKEVILEAGDRHVGVATLRFPDHLEAFLQREQVPLLRVDAEGDDQFGE
jgi:hypothetical protein